MDETLKLLLQFGIPVATVALAAGGIQWQLKNLTERDKKREDDFERFREADRDRSHELNIKLASALDSQATATSKLLDFETARGAQIDGNTQRSRVNRSRIEHLEDADAQAAVRKLAAAGIPEELRNEITDVIRRPPAREQSIAMPKAAESR